MSLISEVEQAFASEGALAAAEVHFVSRPGQTRMAAAVAQAIEGAYPLVVEASTGVGKTYSYLVPALLSGERDGVRRTADQVEGATEQDHGGLVVAGRQLVWVRRAPELAVREPMRAGASRGAQASVAGEGNGCHRGATAFLTGISTLATSAPRSASSIEQ